MHSIPYSSDYAYKRKKVKDNYKQIWQYNTHNV